MALKKDRGQLAALAFDHVDEAFPGFVAEEFVDFLGDERHAEGFGDEGVEAGCDLLRAAPGFPQLAFRRVST